MIIFTRKTKSDTDFWSVFAVRQFLKSFSCITILLQGLPNKFGITNIITAIYSPYYYPNRIGLFYFNFYDGLNRVTNFTHFKQF